jgi:aryl-alcohol dehydrogenase-like predicted oxidoreductase
VEYRAFGRTGIKVSVLALGCGGFGGVGSDPGLFGKGEDRETAFALMDRAWAAGINYFDTADSYGGGASEAMIGEWLRSRGVRERLVLSTKVFNRMGPGPDDAGLSRRHILKAVEDSLRRLQTDHLDLYVTHDDDPVVPLEETLGAFDELVESGKVRAIGASNLTAARLSQALRVSELNRLVRFESMQNEYNLLQRGPESEILPLVRREGLAFTAYSPTSGGWLSGKYRKAQPPPQGSRMALRPEPYRGLENDRTYRAVEALVGESRARGVAPITLALAWVISHSGVTAAIIGPRRVEHFDALLEAVGLQLDAEERQAVSARMDTG